MIKSLEDYENVVLDLDSLFEYKNRLSQSKLGRRQVVKPFLSVAIKRLANNFPVYLFTKENLDEVELKVGGHFYEGVVTLDAEYGWMKAIRDLRNQTCDLNLQNTLFVTGKEDRIKTLYEYHVPTCYIQELGNSETCTHATYQLNHLTDLIEIRREKEEETRVLESTPIGVIGTKEAIQNWQDQSTKTSKKVLYVNERCKGRDFSSMILRHSEESYLVLSEDQTELQVASKRGMNTCFLNLGWNDCIDTSVVTSEKRVYTKVRKDKVEK